MIEAQRVAAFVYDWLKSDTGSGGFMGFIGGRIYRDQVPQAAALPAATVTLVSAVDSNTLGGNRVLNTVLVDVRLVQAGSSYMQINPAADRADDVLQNLSGTTGGVQIVELRRDQTQAFLENVPAAGTTYAHLIQTYRTECYAA